MLSDPRSYSRWVVGSRDVRHADPDWPAPGTRFDHSVGTGPLRLKDHTEVEEAGPPSMLRLRARARPLPSARITIRIDPDGDGARVTMVEDPVLPLGSLLLGPLGHALLRLRNAESLRRLKGLAEGRDAVPEDELPRRDGNGVAARQGGSAARG